jgi:hypothetical protein
MYLVYRAAGGTDEDEAIIVSRLAPGGDIRHETGVCRADQANSGLVVAASAAPAMPLNT